MKRLFVLFILLMAPLNSLVAQTTVNSGSSNIDVQVKRCFASGDDVSIDLMITGRGAWKTLVFQPDGCVFYDDEGNRYTGGLYGRSEYRVIFETQESRHYQLYLAIEKDIARRVRIIVERVDEYASEFSLIKLPYMGDGATGLEGTITIKNIPITRD